MKLYKYSFKSKKAFTTQINKLKVEFENEEDNYFVYEGVKAIVELGFQVIGQDENEEPILGTDYCVDIVWKDDKQADNFVNYEVFPETPSHTIAGW